MLYKPEEDAIDVELSRAINRTDFFRVFSMIASRYGFGSFAVFDLAGAHLGKGPAALCVLADLPEGRDSLEQLDPEAGRALLDRLLALSRPKIIETSHFELAAFMPSLRLLLLPLIAETGEKLVLVTADRQEERREEDTAGAVFDFLNALRKLTSAEGIDAQTPRFSEREVEVIEWTAEGRSSAEIALTVGISEYAVNEHLMSAMRKLDALNRIHLVTKAIRIGIIA